MNYFYQYIYCTNIFTNYVTFLQVSTKLTQAVLKTNWNNVIENMYNYFF